MKQLFFLCLILISASRLDAQYITNPAIEEEKLRDHVQILASDSMQGRATGSPGQLKAAEYLAARFSDIGLLPFDEDYFQPVPLAASRQGDAYIMAGRKKLALYTDLIAGSDPLNTETELELVFGGKGTEAELRAINVKGKAVLIFLDNLRTAGYAQSKLLAEMGATCAIYANPENEIQFGVLSRETRQRRTQYPVRYRREIPPEIRERIGTPVVMPYFIISNEAVEKLTGKSAAALKKLIDSGNTAEFKPASLRVKAEIIELDATSPNVIGLLRGKSDKTLLISAHYDHVGARNGLVFSGADDNASGVAALLELAERFSGTGLPHNLLFVAFTGEELGYIGSEFFASQPGFEAENVLLNLNLDMVSRVDSLHKKHCYLYSLGTKRYPAISEILYRAAADTGDCVFESGDDDPDDPNSLYNYSDQITFHKRNIPAIMFFSGLHSDYHTPGDTADKIDNALFARRVRLVAKALELLLESNEWIHP